MAFVNSVNTLVQSPPPDFFSRIEYMQKKQLNKLFFLILQLCWLFLFVDLFQKDRQDHICTLLDVIRMTKIKIVSHPFQVRPVLSRGNTLLTDIDRELVGELSRDLEHECYPANVISSKVVVI